MAFLDAAYQILKQAWEPLHYRKITERALAQGLIQPSGLTPAATMRSRLYTGTKQEGSRFVRAGRRLFDLAERWAAWEQEGRLFWQEMDALVEMLDSLSLQQPEETLNE